MPLVKKEGSILEDAELDCVVNPCNVVGVMGAGLARALKDKYPDHFKIYKKLCESKELSDKDVILVPSGVKKPQSIVLFPTKRHWKDMSGLLAIEDNLKRLACLLKERESFDEIIGLPAVGCGLGGLLPKRVFVLASEILINTKQEVRWFQ